ncbi:MAG: Zn-dependent hydrolase [Alphaproteobacteria bacterium]|nr:Zn-dependent hydrolase [Alphaproteobacteria bacterium]
MAARPTNLRVNGERLWQSLMAMAEIGKTPKGGVNRPAASDLDRDSRDRFVAWCRDAGLAVRIDRVGNIFARRGGRDDTLPPIVAGSHLDTQPTGGKYDGAYGVLAAFEVVRTLDDVGIETLSPIEVVVWTNEEGGRFSPACTGSGVFAGVFELDYARGRVDRDGKTLGAELARIGYAGPDQVGGGPVGAYFEAHIEQGPILEMERKTIGVVTGAQGVRWYDVVLDGQAAHAGTTPMNRRRDALQGGAELVMAIDALAHRHAPQAVSTIGVLDVAPSSRNTIPGRVSFTVDLRHPDAGVLAAMDREFRSAVAAVAERRKLGSSIEEVWNFPPPVFDPACVGAVREAARALDFSSREIVSGAAHDACYMARIAPTAMVFVPCADGISHNEIESATPVDLAAGCDVLLGAILARAGVL